MTFYNSEHEEFQSYEEDEAIEQLCKRWNRVSPHPAPYRAYAAQDVVRLRGSIKEIHLTALRGSLRFRQLLDGDATKGYINALGALTSGQAVQMAKAGLEAIYLSGWQVAADNNTYLSTYPDQSLYPVDSLVRLMTSIKNAFRLADRIQWVKGLRPHQKHYIDYFLPVIADGEAGFGGTLNTYELCYKLIEAGAAGIHLEDQLSSHKKCGHMGGKVLVPSSEAINKLIAARLAADVADVPTVIIARTDAYSASFITSDCDSRDQPFITGPRTSNGLFHIKCGLKYAIARALAYAPYADLLWCETQHPSLSDAREFAHAIHEVYPNKHLAYNCSPSFNWLMHLSMDQIATFQAQLSDMGYSFQFITLAGIHSSWYNIFDLAYHYGKGEGIKHYVQKVQQKEFLAIPLGYTFVAHQQEVGASYFDAIDCTIQKQNFETSSIAGSIENSDFPPDL